MILYVCIISTSKKIGDIVHFSTRVILRDCFTTEKSNYEEGYKLILEGNNQQHCRTYWTTLHDNTDTISLDKTSVIITGFWIYRLRSWVGILIKASFLCICRHRNLAPHPAKSRCPLETKCPPIPFSSFQKASEKTPHSWNQHGEGKTGKKLSHPTGCYNALDYRTIPISQIFPLWGWQAPYLSYEHGRKRTVPDPHYVPPATQPRILPDLLPVRWWAPRIYGWGADALRWWCCR